MLAVLAGLAGVLSASLTHHRNRSVLLATAVSHTVAPSPAPTERAVASVPAATNDLLLSAPSPGAPTATAPAPVITVATSAAAVRQNLVVLGDSVAAGDACACGGGFGTYLARANGPAALTNDAENGLTSEGLLAELSNPTLVRTLAAATVVTVTIGANDFDPSLASATTCLLATCYQAALHTMTSTIDLITTRLRQLTQPHTTVVLTGYWNVFLDGQVGAANGATYVATSDTLSRQVNAAIAHIAAQHQMLYADLYTPFKGAGSGDDTALLAPDGDHPNAAGHHLIAHAIAAITGLVSV